MCYIQRVGRLKSVSPDFFRVSANVKQSLFVEHARTIDQSSSLGLSALSSQSTVAYLNIVINVLEKVE